MSRRRNLLLGCTGVVIAAALAWYLPRACSPIPGMVAELQACLQENGDDVGVQKLPDDPNAFVEIANLTLGFNATRAETTILAATDAGPRARHGVVTDMGRLTLALERLRDAGCIRQLTTSSLLTSSGCLAFVMLGGEVPTGVAADGAIQYDWCGIKLQSLPTLCSDGRIHLQLELTQSDPIHAAASDAVGDPPFRGVKTTCTMVVRDGETCFIDGGCRKQHVFDEFRVPLLCDLPIVGSSFAFPRESDIDEELLIFATVKRVMPKR